MVMQDGMPMKPVRPARHLRLRPALRRKTLPSTAQPPVPATGAIPLAPYAAPSLTVDQPALREKLLEKSPAGKWALMIIALTSLIWALGLQIGYQNALALQVGMGFILAIAGLASPSLGLLAIGLLCALDAVASDLLLTGGLLRFNTLNYWLLIVMALYLPFILRLRDFSSRALQIFLLLIGLELFLSHNVSEGMQDVLNIVTTFGIVVYFARVTNDQRALYWLGVVNGVSAAVGGLIFFLLFTSIPYTNPNSWTYFQLTALFSICISFTIARRQKRGSLLLIYLAVINFAWIFLSGSRGSLLIALLCGLYLFLSSRSITLSTVIVAVAALGLLWVTTLFVEQQSYTISRIQLLFDPTRSTSQRTSQRSTLARAGWQIFLDNPMGIGTGSFREVVESTTLIYGNRPAHSGWVQTLAENGVPGVILLVVFIGSFSIAGMRHHEGSLVLFGIFITVVIAAALIAKDFTGKSLWFLAAAGITMLNRDNLTEFLHRKLKPTDMDSRARLREIRYGHRRR
jgi:O-antigen ligase